MVRKALCVGCDYPSKAFGLAGGVNDAFLLAECLQLHFDFGQENITVLHDVYPGQKKSMTVDPSRAPTRVNIIHHLQWLVRNARSGDVLFFSFSGYGLHVDDMDGCQDEGYDEAILPTDFVDGRDGDYTVIVADDIHDILMGIPHNCSVTVLMDCDHATSIIDVSGTVDGRLVDGLKYNNFCGLKGHTVKMHGSSHNRDAWQDEKARAVKARPRFQPMMEIDNPHRGRLPTRPAMSRSTPVAFCLSAAGHGQTAMEIQRTVCIDGRETQKQYGILSWSFVKALEELKYNCTYMDLLMGIRRQFHDLKEKDLPRLDQEVLLTCSMPLSNPSEMRVLMPVIMQGGQQASRSISEQSRSAPMPFAVPAVVPPPPPGVISGQGVAAPGAAMAVCERMGPATGASGVGTCGVSGAGHSVELDEAWPPLLPPPLPSGTCRCSSELVHHDIAPGEGGSFQVHGGTVGLMLARSAGENWYEQSVEAASRTSGRPDEGQLLPPSTSTVGREPPHYGPATECSTSSEQDGIGHPPPGSRQGSGQAPACDPAQDVKLNGAELRRAGAQNPSEIDLFGFLAGGGFGQPGAAPALRKWPGLTPPNLFGGGSGLLTLGQSFGQGFSQLHAGAVMAGIHGPPSVAPRWQ